MQELKEFCTHEPFLRNLLEDEFYPTKRDNDNRRSDSRHFIYLILDWRLKGMYGRGWNILHYMMYIICA